MIVLNFLGLFHVGIQGFVVYCDPGVVQKILDHGHELSETDPTALILVYLIYQLLKLPRLQGNTERKEHLIEFKLVDFTRTVQINTGEELLHVGCEVIAREITEFLQETLFHDIKIFIQCRRPLLRKFANQNSDEQVEEDPVADNDIDVKVKAASHCFRRS